MNRSRQGVDSFCVVRLSQSFGVEFIRDHVAGFSPPPPPANENHGSSGEDGLVSLLDYLKVASGKPQRKLPPAPLLTSGLTQSQPPQQQQPSVDRLIFVMPLSGRYQVSSIRVLSLRWFDLSFEIFPHECEAAVW